tara:strand:+ start:1275 stop:2150 length:876 start_codon:yes stop_codon:yes gene_type:complete
MKNYLLKFISFLFITFLSLNVFAANCNYAGTPSEYKITMTSAMLCQDYSLTTGACAGSNDFTIGTFSKACDIAAVASGAEACTYGPLAGMPIGETFKYFRVTMDRDFTITAEVTPTASMEDTSGNTNSGCINRTIRTESSNTNTSAQVSHGANEASSSAGAAESQVMTMPNMTGNETTGCTTACIPTTKDTAVDSCDSTSFTSHVDGNYNATMSLCTPEYSIWMGGLNATDDSLTIIYMLTSPYTVGVVTPKLKMSFDMTGSVTMYNNSSDTSFGGMIYVQEPIVEISLTD